MRPILKGWQPFGDWEYPLQWIGAATPCGVGEPLLASGGVARSSLNHRLLRFDAFGMRG